jgi:HemY protein
MAAAEFMIDQRQPQSALVVLQTLRDNGVKHHAGALKLELKAHQQAGNWSEVLNVLAQLEKRVAVDVTTSTLVRQQAYLDSIAQQHDQRELVEHLKTIPPEFKRRNKIAAAAARALIQLGGCPLTASLLADSLNSEWHSELVALYAECQSGDVLGQIEQAEQWLKKHKDDAALLLTLGKLCAYQKLWGKAKTYLDASISITPSAAGYNALGQLAERLGESSFAYYQQAVNLSSRV